MTVQKRESDQVVLNAGVTCGLTVGSQWVIYPSDRLNLMHKIKVTDGATVAFAKGFYDALANNNPVELTLVKERQGIRLEKTRLNGAYLAR